MKSVRDRAGLFHQAPQSSGPVTYGGTPGYCIKFGLSGFCLYFLAGVVLRGGFPGIIWLFLGMFVGMASFFVPLWMYKNVRRDWYEMFWQSRKFGKHQRQFIDRSAP